MCVSSQRKWLALSCMDVQFGHTFIAERLPEGKDRCVGPSTGQSSTQAVDRMATVFAVRQYRIRPTYPGWLKLDRSHDQHRLSLAHHGNWRERVDRWISDVPQSFVHLGGDQFGWSYTRPVWTAQDGQSVNCREPTGSRRAAWSTWASVVVDPLWPSIAELAGIGSKAHAATRSSRMRSKMRTSAFSRRSSYK